MAEGFSQGEAATGVCVTYVCLPVEKSLKTSESWEVLEEEISRSLDGYQGADLGRAGKESAQRLGLFWCLRELFWFISRDAALWYQQNHSTKTKYHFKQRYRFLSTSVWRHAPENCGFSNSCDENAVRGDSVPADCKNIRHLLLLTAEGTKLNCRMTNTWFQFLVLVVLGSHQGHCCYCCKNTAAGWCLWNQGKETQSGKDGWGCCGGQDVS